MSLTGDADGPPFRAGISVFDVMAGLHGLIGVLAALHQRERDRRGPARRGEPARRRRCRGSSTRPGPTPRPASSRHGWATPTPACTRTRRCRPADRDMIITAGNNRQFRSLCEVLGIREVADDERFAAQRRPHAQPRRAASAAGRAAAPSGRPTTCSSRSTRPACRAGRSTTSARASSWPSRSGSTHASRSAMATARSTWCATRSRSATPTFATTCRRPGSASTPTRSGRGCGPPPSRSPGR